MAQIPPKIRKEMEEAFFLFDYDKDNKITGKEIGAVVRSVGLNPTEAELKEMCKEVDSKGGKVDINGLCQVMAPRLKTQMTTADELRDAFQVFDKFGNGTVQVQDLRHSLTTLGEKLKDEELDELVREVDQDGDGQITFDNMIRVLLAMQ